MMYMSNVMDCVKLMSYLQNIVVSVEEGWGCKIKLQIIVPATVGDLLSQR